MAALQRAIDDAGRVVGFLEKPQTKADLEMVRTDPAWIDRQGIPAKGRNLMASMGIYLFDRDCLLDLLTKTDYQDFGREVFPAAIRTKRVFLHPFDGYWEDIGTIPSFFEAHMNDGAMSLEVHAFERAEGACLAPPPGLFDDVRAAVVDAAGRTFELTPASFAADALRALLAEPAA